VYARNEESSFDNYLSVCPGDGAEAATAVNMMVNFSNFLQKVGGAVQQAANVVLGPAQQMIRYLFAC
jgi:hypothetical protein